VKTIVRCAFFGHRPVVFKSDVETASSEAELPVADVIHHVGVLYHLKDPVRHLRQLGRLAKVALMLDTHYALDHEVTQTYVAAGDTYAYKHYREHGTRDPFSGMYDHSKWLRLDDIVRVLRDSGFGRVDIAERRDERNGPRVLLFAEKTAPVA
jgi:tRNA (mo5U34)-methyltransferase